MILERKNIIITGASRGLGKVIADICLGHGANLLLVARSREALETQRKALLSSAKFPGQIAEICATDLSKEAATELIAAKALSYFEKIDGLINNAGILGPVGKAWENNWRDWEATIRVNLLAPVDLCRAFAPLMLQSGSGSIINLSGGGATGPRPNFTAYATSKTGLVRFSEILAQELKGSGVRVNSIAPGAIATDMLKEVFEAGADKIGEEEFAKVLKQMEGGGTPPQRAAELCAFLCSDAAKEISGRIISAAWDPWETLADRAAELSGSDIYTLRRIVPEDRGKKW